MIEPLTIFGLVAVSAMLAFYTLEARGAGFVLAFAASCAAASLYAALAGAWPFAVVEIIWAGVAIRRWQRKLKPAT